MAQYKFTSESVSEGHPDKLADQISDAIVDEALRLAGDSADRVRCACETLVKGNLLVVAGEMRNPCLAPDYLGIAKKVAQEIGYDGSVPGFDPENCIWIDGITKQSNDIAQGVDAKDGGGANCSGAGNGAGDQGLMFGYACSETKPLMPLPIYLAHKLMRQQAKLRRGGANWLGPDAKSQVTVVYENGKPVKIDTVVLSTQHTEEIDGQPYDKVLEDRVKAEIIEPVLADVPQDNDNCCYIVNPTKRFVDGGPDADAGLTGRKIIVDTYGGAAPHGGGAFSGKDPSKVDRSATYAARQLAKNVVAAKLATRCLVQVSYAIGVVKPVSMMVDTFCTGKIDDDKIAERLAASFDMTPKGIIERLDLLRPIYRQTAAYGHFGREDVSLPWEDTSLAAKLAD